MATGHADPFKKLDTSREVIYIRGRDRNASNIKDGREP